MKNLLAEDHTILLEGLTALLAPGFGVVATAGDGRAVLEAAEKHHPDFILLDISIRRGYCTSDIEPRRH
jgi:DNA-binding NarL/FixJ family response regulator